MGQLCDDLKHVIQSLNRGHIRNSTEEENKKVNLEVNRRVSEMMKEYTLRKGKRIWCEKSPYNLHYLNVLNEIFPEGRYICLYRHCLDRTRSCMEAAHLMQQGVQHAKTSYKESLIYYIRNQNEIDALIDSWIDQTQRLLDFERNNSAKCFHLKYESLVIGAAEVMKALFSFLELKWDPTLLDSVFTQQHDLGWEDPKTRFSKSIHTKSVGASSSFPVKSIHNRLLHDMNNLLVDLEYPPVAMNWGDVAAKNLGLTYLPEASGKIPERGGARNQFERTNEFPAKDKIVSNTEEIFATYFSERLRIHANELQGLRIVIKFCIHGDGGGIWLLDLNDQARQIISRDGNADCTITISAKDFHDIITGELNAAEALASGILKISGNLKQAFEIGRILLLN